MDRKLNRLKTIYEQYFLGLEKFEPAKLRKEVGNLVRRYTATTITNTAIKFRLDGIIARYNALQGYWNRILREIEEGRYERDVFKTKLHEQERAEKEAEESGVAYKMPARGAAPTANDPVTRLFAQYVEVRKKNKESVEGITREKMDAVIRKQSDVIKKRYGCKRVSFKVVTENGKTRIKAVPKK